jgi:hypothetical protein
MGSCFGRAFRDFLGSYRIVEILMAETIDGSGVQPSEGQLHQAGNRTSAAR